MRVAPPAEPLPELDRLRRPTGPWLHLLDAAPSDARQLGWMLGQHGVVVRILRGHCLRTGYGLFDEVAAALQLPGDPVEDWSALAALLTDMGWLPGDGHVLVVTRAALLLAAAPLSELHGFVAAVREVARGRAEEGAPVPFHVLLQDNAVGLAALCARLDAVGARYLRLSGWDAEEPAASAAAGGRSLYSAGDPGPDNVDRAVTAALSRCDGVVEVRRCWEEFRGPSSGRVRVYAPVLAGADAAADVAAAAAAAAAELGGACVIVPLPARGTVLDERQQAVATVAVAIWPEPPPLPDPPPPNQAAKAVERAAVPGAAGSVERGLPVSSAATGGGWAGAGDHPPAASEPAADRFAARPAGPEPAEAARRPGGPPPDVGEPGPALDAPAGEPASFAASAAEVTPAVPATVPDAARTTGDSPAGLALPADASFVSGPGRDSEASTRLVDWAAGRPGVTGVVTAWTEIGGRPVLVVGVVADRDTDQDAVRAEVGAVVGPGTPHLVEPLVPAAGLTPLQLQLYRSSTRLWTRRVERPAAAGRALDTGYRPRTSGVDDVIEYSTPVLDTRLPGGFTIVGLDLTSSIRQGPERPDERDAAVADWVRAQGHTLALLRAVTSGRRGTDIPVYSVLVDEDAQHDAVRRGVADVVAGTGTDRCAVEVFCPLRKLSVFQVQLYGASLALWKTDRPRSAPTPPKPAAD